MPPRSTPRRRNLNLPSHAHELTFSCYRGFPFLRAERTCTWLAEAIDKARTEHQFSLWSYVFMPEHVHLILCPHNDVYDVASIRRSIKEPVARRAIRHLAREASPWLSKISRQRGKRVERLFWQSGGGYDRNINNPKTLAVMIDYIHGNPGRRNLVENPADWRWSSAAWYEGKKDGDLLVDPIPVEWSVD
ncbi:MAG: transposase [Planctomycetes bacterium]|nr:transposase [Planctomycetota bacterium]